MFELTLCNSGVSLMLVDAIVSITEMGWEVRWLFIHGKQIETYSVSTENVAKMLPKAQLDIPNEI